MKVRPQLGRGTSLDRNKHASIAYAVELSTIRLGEATKKKGREKKKKKKEGIKLVWVEKKRKRSKGMHETRSR
jgi:hypothetical protein